MQAQERAAREEASSNAEALRSHWRFVSDACDSLRSLLDAEESRRLGLEKGLPRETRIGGSLREGLDALERAASSAQRQGSRALGEPLSARGLVDAYSDLRETLRDEQRALRCSSAQLRERHLQLQEAKTQLEAERRQLEAEKEALREAALRLERRSHEVEREKTRAERALAEAGGLREEWEAKNAQQREAAAEAEASAREVLAREAALAAREEALEAAVETLRRQTERLEAQSEFAERERNRLRRECEAHTQERRRLAQQRADLHRREERLAAEEVRLARQEAALAQKSRGLRSERKELEGLLLKVADRRARPAAAALPETDAERRTEGQAENQLENAKANANAREAERVSQALSLVHLVLRGYLRFFRRKLSCSAEEHSPTGRRASEFSLEGGLTSPSKTPNKAAAEERDSLRGSKDGASSRGSVLPTRPSLEQLVASIAEPPSAEDSLDASSAAQPVDALTLQDIQALEHIVGLLHSLAMLSAAATRQWILRPREVRQCAHRAFEEWRALARAKRLLPKARGGGEAAFSEESSSRRFLTAEESATADGSAAQLVGLSRAVPTKRPFAFRQDARLSLGGEFDDDDEPATTTPPTAAGDDCGEGDSVLRFQESRESKENERDKKIGDWTTPDGARLGEHGQGLSGSLLLHSSVSLNLRESDASSDTAQRMSISELDPFSSSRSSGEPFFVEVVKRSSIARQRK